MQRRIADVQRESNLSQVHRVSSAQRVWASLLRKGCIVHDVADVGAPTVSALVGGILAGGKAGAFTTQVILPHMYRLSPHIPQINPQDVSSLFTVAFGVGGGLLGYVAVRRQNNPKEESVRVGRAMVHAPVPIVDMKPERKRAKKAPHTRRV